MQILIVNFNLDGLSEEDFASSADELAPAFAAVPGLASKVWLADRAEGIFGGVYMFESEQAVDDYLASDLFAGIGATPGLVNISVRRFGVLDGPTRVTRGLVQPAVV
jgi:putative monooxygenase ydhR